MTDLVERLRQRLPITWKLDVNVQASSRFRPDACLCIAAPNGTKTMVVVEVKTGKTIRLGEAMEQLRRYTESFPGSVPLVAMPYIGPTARALLARSGFGYADVTGNLRLVLEEPALFIETTGADRDPWPDNQPLRSLRGGAAGRAVRAFCDVTPPYGTRELAERLSVPAPTLSRVAELLEREGILRRERNRGRIVAVDWQLALRRWSEDYGFTRSNRTSMWLEPRGLQAVQEKLRGTAFRYVLTGSLAANAIAPIAAPKLAALYVENVGFAAGQLGLRPAESGGNVLLAEPFNAVAFERGFEREGLRYAAYSQAAVDLMTGPGRWPAEAEAVLKWMQANERAWRT